MGERPPLVFSRGGRPPQRGPPRFPPSGGSSHVESLALFQKVGEFVGYLEVEVIPVAVRVVRGAAFAVDSVDCRVVLARGCPVAILPGPCLDGAVLRPCLIPAAVAWPPAPPTLRCCSACGSAIRLRSPARCVRPVWPGGPPKGFGGEGGARFPCRSTFMFFFLFSDAGSKMISEAAAKLWTHLPERQRRVTGNDRRQDEQGNEKLER